jgi:hypothetical protein
MNEDLILTILFTSLMLNLVLGQGVFVLYRAAKMWRQKYIDLRSR